MNVIAFDLDGTLLNKNNQILQENKTTIQRLQKNGIKIILVTGRHHTAVKPYYYELGLTTPVVCCNGTYIYDFHQNTILTANPLSWQQSRTIIELSEIFDLNLLTYTESAMNYTRLNDHMIKFTKWVETCNEDVRPNVQKLTNFYELLANQETILKFVISHSDNNILKKATEKLSKEQFSCEWSWYDRVDIANVGNTKGRRLLELLTYLGENIENTIAFGDNHNDISMLRSVGYGIAMENADIDVKRAAKRTIGNNDTTSIADILNEIYKLR